MSENERQFRCVKVSPCRSLFWAGLLGLLVACSPGLVHAHTHFSTVRTANVHSAIARADTNADTVVIVRKDETETEKDLPPVQAFDLRAYFVPAENDDWLTGDVWKPMPRGRTNFASIDFQIDGLIQMARRISKRNSRSFRDRVSFHVGGNDVGAAHFLGGTVGSDEPGAVVAFVVWRYADGSHARLPIRYAHHARDIWRMPYEDPPKVLDPHAKVAWIHQTQDNKQSGRMTRLYKFTLGNPHREKVVEWLELYAGESDPSLLVVALTLDPLKPGERPDPTEDLEPQDPEVAGRLEVTVVAEESARPIHRARVAFWGRYRTVDGYVDFKRDVRTGTNGIARVTYPAKEFTALHMRTKGDGRAEVETLLPPRLKSIPDKLVVRLPAGSGIGGRVLDEKGAPIAKARVTMHRIEEFPNLNPQSVREASSGPKSHFTTFTDENGIWTSDQADPSKLTSYRLQVHHNDFKPMHFTMEQIDEAAAATLTARTHEIRLARGLELKGRVTDTDNVPISDATVRVGQKHEPGARTAKTDADGRFHVRGIGPDPQFGMVPRREADTTATNKPIVRISKFIGVQAEGFRPEGKTIEIVADTDEVNFQLQPGRSLRGVVVDEKDAPIPSVLLIYESYSHPGILAQSSLIWNGYTDADGRFEWRGVPDGDLMFHIMKEGFGRIRGMALEAGETEHRIVLKKARKVLGRVVEAGTGKPVREFSIVAGQSYGRLEDPRFNFSPSDERSFADENGEFEFSLDDQTQTILRIRSGTHGNKMHRVPEGEEREIQVTIELEPAIVYTGWVVDAEDEPIAGARVILIKAEIWHQLDMDNGRVQNLGRDATFTFTNADGWFQIAADTETPSRLFIVHDSGSAELDVPAGGAEELLIVLEGWGRVEGTVWINGQPTKGVSITMQGERSTQKTVVTDENGYFTFEKVPAGRMDILRWISRGHRPRVEGHTGVQVDVRGGRTTWVDLIFEGATVEGTFRIPDYLKLAEGSQPSGTFSLVASGPPRFASGDEARNWYYGEAGREHRRQNRTYPVQFTGDRFAIEAVPPGEYSLDIELIAGDGVSRARMIFATRNIVVSDTGTISVGEVLLDQPSRREP